MDAVKKIVEILTAEERKKVVLLFLAIVVMAGLQVVSVASVMPFLSVAADPSKIHENYYLQLFYKELNFNSERTYLAYLGVLTFIALVVSNMFRTVTTWGLYRFSWRCNHSISVRLLEEYLKRPYKFFINRNSSELGKNILEEVKEIVTGMLIPGLRGMAKAVVALFIIAFLVFINPYVATLVALVLGISYSGIYYLVKNRIDYYGEQRVKNNTKRYQFVNEAFGGIKQVKIQGKEKKFLDKYFKPSRLYSDHQSKYRIFKKIPRYMLEVVAFGGIILIAIYLIVLRDGIGDVIPVLGLYAFAGYRLMPAVQRIFNGIASVRYNVTALRKVQQGLQEAEKSSMNLRPNGQSKDHNYSIELKNSIRLKSIQYTYPNSAEPAIEHLNLDIKANTTVGVVGKTGSGKTTTVDIIIGLLRPSKGEVFVDDTKIRDDNVSNWQKNVGYVPQKIFLTDGTITQNIAFGEPTENVDMNRVKQAARRAHIFDFIQSDLPKKWATNIGEDGVRLSGGQRQRIGIARALYYNPSMLVFDEATSALDQKTESSVMNAIYELEYEHTILIVAHRLSSVKRADKVVMLDDGLKVNEGTYENLLKKEGKFQKMASA